MAKKRANGEGSIRKRKDGRWEGRYTVGHDPVTGKQVFKNVLPVNISLNYLIAKKFRAAAMPLFLCDIITEIFF